MQDAEKKDERTVEEVFEIDEDQLHVMADHDSFWVASDKFYHQVKNEKYEELSEKQQEWLIKLDRGVNEENNR